MLVLTRKDSQKILIGDDIVITFLEISKKSGIARVGIDAPKDVVILRDEVKARQDAELDVNHELNGNK